MITKRRQVVVKREVEGKRRNELGRRFRNILLLLLLLVLPQWWFLFISENRNFSSIYRNVYQSAPPSIHHPHQKRICPTAKSLFFDPTYTSSYQQEQEAHDRIEEVQRQADLFHNQGGNLQRLQHFLDSRIDATYRELGVEYTPRDPDHRSPSMVKNIINDFKKFDTKQRGGYEQRRVEGSYTKVGPGMNGARGMVDVLEPTAGLEKWTTAMGPMGPACQSLNVIHPAGRKTYEDKYMCNYEDYRKPTTPTQQDHQPECDIISIGSNDEWGFESVVTSETVCVTHTFDCTIQNPKRKPSSDAVIFYSVCIAGDDHVVKDRQYQSYGSMLRTMNVSDPPAFLKMDVEGFEFDTLTAMLQEDVHRQESAESLLPKQISIELHYFTRMYDLPWNMRSRQTGELAMFFGIMYRLGGYLPVHYVFDPGCSSCLEVLFVRIFC